MEGDRNARRIGTASGFFLLALVGIALLINGLYPTELPESRNPDFVDNVFDNRAILLAGRLLLVSAAGVLALGGTFIAASIGIRMKNGEWLRRAGPFEISERKAAQAEEEIDYWRQEALAGERKVVALRQLLESTDELATNLTDSN